MSTSLMAALSIFDAAEANLEKLERLVRRAEELQPSGVQFHIGASDYDDICHSIELILEHLPKIDGWRPSAMPMPLNAIAQDRIDAMEVGFPEAHISVEEEIARPASELRRYRHLFNSKRRALVRQAMGEHIDSVDAIIAKLTETLSGAPIAEDIPSADKESLSLLADKIALLLGGSAKLPERWSDFRRHIHFGMVGDFNDIKKHDWPQIKGKLIGGMYAADDPIPVSVQDLSDVLASKPTGPITTKLDWSVLDEDHFERLIFVLIGSEKGYENVSWLMHTNATDRGRDLSAYRVMTDSLSGTIRSRVIVQCRHRRKNVSIADLAVLRDQMKLWSDPRVDILVVATTGRFSADAVTWVEKHNVSDSALKIEMWPDSHLEQLLTTRPTLVAEFKLRKAGE